MTRDGRKVVPARCRGKRLECPKCKCMFGEIEFPDQIGGAMIFHECRRCGVMLKIGRDMKLGIEQSGAHR